MSRLTLRRPEFLGSLGVPWTPAFYPQARWVDAIDSSMLTLSGSAVTQINDKNGNTGYYAQSTASQRPTYDPTGLNGKGVLLFNGNNTMLGVNTDYYTSDWCAVVVGRQANAAATGTFFSKWNSGGNQREFTFRASNTNTLAMFVSTNGTSSTAHGTAATIGTSYGVFGVYKNGTTGICSINGQQGSPATISATVFNGSAEYQLGALQGAEFLAGGIQKVVFIPGAYSLAVFQQLEGWAAWDSGLQGSLVPSHPYKNSRPYL